MSTNKTLRKVLILDDDRRVLQTLERYLKAPHLDIVTCSEIEAAECLMDLYHFDVLVTDLEVSDLGGLEGIRLIRHAAVHYPHLQVIVFSGKLNQQVRNLGEILKVTELLEKPVELNRLRDVIDDGTPEPTRSRAGESDGKVTHVGTLDAVLRKRSISAVLQPILHLDPATKTWESFGAEGLARGPEGSLLRNPELLLGYASKKERLFDTELLCVEAVLGEAHHLNWIDRLFLNVRPRSLTNSDFAPALCDLVDSHGFQPRNIVLELTEQQSILNLHAFDATLETLHRLGFSLALDDFGRGFANLQLLQRLPLDYLKIDGFFCQGIEHDRHKRSIVRSTLAMAEDLGIRTIIERVETESELEIISELGATFAQGYYFSRPASGRELAVGFKPLPQPLVENSSAVELSPVPTQQDRVQHEISNSLTAIALYAAQCLKQIEKDHPLFLDLEEILAESERAVALSANGSLDS